MTTTAGFDFVAELAPQTIVGMFKLAFRREGEEAPSFPYELAGPPGPVSGGAYAQIQDFGVDRLSIEADDRLVFRLPFDHGSVEVDSPVSAVLCELSGDLEVTVPLGAADQLIDLQAASAHVDFSPESEAQIAHTVPGPMQGVAHATADEAVTAAIHGIGAQEGGLDAIGLDYSIVPGTDGSLQPLQFAAAETHCVFDADPGKRAVGLFATFLTANQGHGDHTQKTETAIPTGNDFCFSIGEEAFCKLVFCASAADALGATDASALPADCGSGELDLSGFKVTHLGCSLNRFRPIGLAYESEFFAFWADLKAEADCSRVRSTVASVVTLSISNNRLQPTVQSVDIQTFEIDTWGWCIFAAPLVPLVKAWFWGIAEDLAAALRNRMKFPAMTLDSESAARVRSVSIYDDALTMAGTVNLPAPTVAERSVWVWGAVSTLSTREVASGTADTQVCGHIPVEIAWTEYEHDLGGIFHAEAQLVTPPLTIRWELWDGTQWIQLAPGHHTMTLPGVANSYPNPYGQVTIVDQDVTIDYALTDDRLLEVRNDPASGNYSLQVGVTVRDCSGTTMRGEGWFAFEGLTVLINNPWEMENAIRECLNEHAIVKLPHLPGKTPILPVDHPAPEQVRGFLTELLRAGLPGALEVASAAHLLHGDRLLRSSPPSDLGPSPLRRMAHERALSAAAKHERG